MNLADKKILITGAHGFLGKHLVHHLQTAHACSRANLVLPHKSECDLRKWEDALSLVQGTDLVIHLAANVGGIGYNEKYPGTLFFDNALMGINLIEAARVARIQKIVILGTICAYPKNTPIPFKEDDLWNGYPEETNAPYGLAKKMLLVQCQAYRAQYGLNAIYLLPVNLYGEEDSFDPLRSHVIPALIRKIDEAQKSGASFIEVWGTGKPTREFLYVEDAAEGIALAAQNYDNKEPVNLGSHEEISIKDLAMLIAECMDFHGEIRFNPDRPDGQPRRKLDVSRAEREFGFRARHTLRTGLQKTITWYKAHQAGKEIL